MTVRWAVLLGRGVDWALKLLRLTVQAPWLSETGGYAQQLGRAVGLAPCPGRTKDMILSCRASVALLSSGAGLKIMLNSCVGLLVCFPAWVGHRTCPTPGMALWLGIQIRQNRCVPGQTVTPAQLYRRAAVWDLCLGTAINRNIFHEDLSTGCFKPCPPFPSLSGLHYLSYADSPSDPMR